MSEERELAPSALKQTESKTSLGDAADLDNKIKRLSLSSFSSSLYDLAGKSDSTNSLLSPSSSANAHLIQTQSNNNNNSLLNEKVASLASSMYTELEKMVKSFGQDTVKDLMPIVVSVLEALDTAYQEKEEFMVDIELLKDDYEKLLSQYEKEKQSRKDTEMVRFPLISFLIFLDSGFLLINIF
jgi:hypothetical protein